MKVMTTPEQTALREADQEIGLDPGDVKVLGRLANMITITYFRVTPVVGVIKWPAVFKVGEHEVAWYLHDPAGLAGQPIQPLAVRIDRVRTFR